MAAKEPTNELRADWLFLTRNHNNGTKAQQISPVVLSPRNHTACSPNRGFFIGIASVRD